MAKVRSWTISRMLQQPYNDRQYQAAQGRGRLSLAPAPSRLYGGELIENERPPPRSQPVYQDTYGDEDQVYPTNAICGSLNRFAYNAHQSLESSSDVPLGASSSPALNAGRRRAGQYDSGASQHVSQLQPLEDLPDEPLADARGNVQNQRETVERPSEPSRRDIGHPFQQITDINTDGPSHALPIVQGIRLVPVSALPDRLRTVFPFLNFNAVQSKCFDQVFRSDNNFVLSSPTGSGKTAILELAICRAVVSNSTGPYKVVYQAPTKALCSERQRDWDQKFNQIGLKCAELTGDSNATDLCNVQSANIIITTPEKWDSMTRKWKDHEKLMRLIKLFLIDEVHILNDDRGAVLEAVVSRMKSIGTDVRFIALSATVPNFHDVAAWLGKSSSEPYASAPNEKFGEEFRPVKLRKYVCGYVCNNSNDFAFEKQLDAKLPEIIMKYSERKPIMIFCATRKSCFHTAQLIANWWGSKNGRERLWNPPSQAIHMRDKEHCKVVASGVAFHHAGLDHEDRIKVEQAFLKGDINVICCTSTLAVGVNLPCHLVIIKNTTAWMDGSTKEYSDLEMMQMLGRAGRPQFDDSAVAVIMTRYTKVRRYENLVTGEDILESKLHLNLVNHMNAEIGLGTIRDLESARKWLMGTFLYVRLQQNPSYYKLEGSRNGQDIQEQVDNICFRDIALLKEHNLASGEEYFRCTEFGHAMARYYVRFETMRVFMGLQKKSTLSEILSAVAQAAEFSKIRFRQGEKSIYKTINRSPSIRFPIPVNLDSPAQKVSLVIQSVLGHAEINWESDMSKHKAQYQQEVATIFKSINNLVRCIIDCQIVLGDSVSIHSALMLERCLGSKAWDDSPLQMVQVPNIGTVAVRKLVNAGIHSIEDLESTDARRIETIVGRNPPFGLKVLEDLRSFPKLRVSLRIQPSSVIKTPEGAKVQVMADIGFINESPSEKFNKNLIYVCMLAETSDGRKVHFTRMNGHRLGMGQSLVFPALLTSPEQKINCYLMCEGIAGSMRDATLAPKIAPSTFPVSAPKAVEPAPTHQPNMSRRRVENTPMQRRKSFTNDDFGDADLDDDALVKASCDDLDFDHIDNFADPTDAITRSNTAKNNPAKEKDCSKAPATNNEDDGEPAPDQLPNGRWPCNHKCKDKEACKHYCCKHGMDKPPKKTAPKRAPIGEHQNQSPPSSSAHRNDRIETKLNLQSSKRKTSTAIEELDLTQQEKKRKPEYAINGPRDYRDLHKLHKDVQKKDMPASLHSVMKTKPAYCYGEGGEHQLSFLSHSTAARPETSSEYGDLEFDDLTAGLSALQNKPTYSDELSSLHFRCRTPVTSRGSDTFGDDESMFGEAIVGLADSQDLRAHNLGTASMQNYEARDAISVAEDFTDVDFPVDIDFSAKYISPDPPNQHSKTCAPLLEAISSPEQSRNFKPAKPMLQNRELGELQQGKAAPSPPSQAAKDLDEEEDVYSDLLDMLDMPLAANNKANTKSDNHPAKVKAPVQSVETKQEEPKQVPEGFKDLQPWLFQEFGDIVELVDE
ncbi:P-loop containing nucleoside triphosphate hydrolase protein [Didymella exigua CBS 183.55]|uniref:DNA 3'-5' helicase n=1 Tax=Didymella exigua CBS 183.55 TaxID=1150837 RepID=A0A6A5R4F8_9PLEO|nr:P-loop containing nucleoside triphosphate hydrolase protein [Didymella exigua CBS 183.55]KAF1922985.1 P-loop containing nucleoside triphosphate hydrolase protein [Didymella exigua CBS 183.55]